MEPSCDLGTRFCSNDWFRAPTPSILAMTAGFVVHSRLDGVCFDACVFCMNRPPCLHKTVVVVKFHEASFSGIVSDVFTRTRMGEQRRAADFIFHERLSWRCHVDHTLAHGERKPHACFSWTYMDMPVFRKFAANTY